MGRWTMVALIVALSFACGCRGSSQSSTGTSGPAPPDDRPAVRVQGSGFVDRANQPVVLRGVDVHTLDPQVYTSAATLGANFLRVAVPWSDYEPAAPVAGRRSWDIQRLDELDALVRWCDGAHVNVLLDLHEYGWSPYFAALSPGGRANGIPAWVYADGRYPITEGGLNRAKRAFYRDREVESLYAGFASMLAERYRDSPSVMGYEVLNEPDTGSMPRTHRATQLVIRWEAGVVAALRQADPNRAIVFMARGGPSMGALHADLSPFGGLENLVLDVHDYFAGTGGSGYQPDGENLSSAYRSTLQGGAYTGTTASQRGYLDVSLRAAHRWNIPLIVGEWGAFQGTPGLGRYQAQMVGLFRRLGLSWARWSLDRRERLGLLDRDGGPTAAAVQLQRLLRSQP